MHYLAPSRSSAYLVLFYCNFKAIGPHSHIGLGVNGLHTLKVLRRNRVHTDLFGVRNAADINAKLTALTAAKTIPTHVVIEAPSWISVADIRTMLFTFPATHFIVRTHSQIAFLQADKNAITAVRELILLEEGMPNFTVCANNTRLATFLRTTYTGKCLYLPNLYDFERTTSKPGVSHHHRVLRVGSFGALRPLKNHTTAGAAALMLAARRGTDLEFWISVGRDDASSAAKESLRNMFVGLPHAKLMEYSWNDWPMFRRIVANMDLNMQLSFTESFCLTAADSVAEGVPCVVSSAIEWAPSSWQADSDDAEDAMRIGSALLSDTHAAADGLKALTTYVTMGTHLWVSYLDGNPAALIQ